MRMNTISQYYFGFELKVLPLEQHEKAIGTCNLGGIIAQYDELVQILGEPTLDMLKFPNKWSKVSTKWIIELDIPEKERKIQLNFNPHWTWNPRIFTIYDYKTTNIYDGYSPSIEDFRKEWYYWNIGGIKYDDELGTFLRWLSIELHNLRCGVDPE